MVFRCISSVALVCALIATFTSAAIGQTCFGAAARDPQRGCSTREAGVVPTPRQAAALPNSPCVAVPHQTTPAVCGCGAPAETGKATVALVGDSHAGHWRAALTHVALA